MEPKSTKNKKTKPTTPFEIGNIQGKTPRQKQFFQKFKDYQVLSLSGFAGSGKSFCALAAALKSVEKGEHAEVLIIRSAVPSREIGFMPGGKKEKISVYESPYTSICTKLYNRGDAYSILKQKGILQFESTSFLRGETFDNKILLIDEAQNMSDIELFTILTRVGVNCKVIICGDAMQDDLTSERYKERSGYLKMLTILQGMDEVLNIEFGVDDIVRSGFVKSLIIRYNEKD